MLEMIDDDGARAPSFYQQDPNSKVVAQYIVIMVDGEHWICCPRHHVFPSSFYLLIPSPVFISDSSLFNTSPYHHVNIIQ